MAPSAGEPSASTRLLGDSTASDSDNGTFPPSSLTPRASSPPLPSGPPSTTCSASKPPRRHTNTRDLAQSAGVQWSWPMYLSYYIPILQWAGRYDWSFLFGDVIAGVTMASFYIPMALSLSANLAHLPPIHGLYSFAIQPLVYGLLGSCPTMAVGPEAAGSLLMGSAIRLINEHHTPVFDDDGSEGDGFQNARLAGVITVMTGCFAFMAGTLRLGFLDSVLSRPLLRGFISGVGFVIFVDQLLPEMGLIELAKKQHITHASTMSKLLWILQNLSHTHMLTFSIALVSFTIIMVGREVKKHVGPRHNWVVFLPDRFLVVVLSAILTYNLRWDERGLEILGEVKADGTPFRFVPPVSLGHLNYAKEALSTAFLISVLGFFESVVAAKALGTTLDVSISSNRELMALGTANILGGCFQALPAFGGYGRSKVNKAAGGRTPLSSVVLSLLTILCVLKLLPAFHYLPSCVLCAMISVVGYSLLEEAPADIYFFYTVRAWSDLATMSLVFLTTLLWNLSTGIATGVAVSLIQVIRHSTKARTQILGRDPTTGQWRAAVDDDTTPIETTPHTLVIKIRESLTFANAGDLARRLWRIDRYGDSHAHPSLPRIKQGVSGVVFDVAGVASIDGSGAQVLFELVEKYVKRDVGVWFARVSVGEVWERFEKSGIVAIVGGKERFVGSVEEALKKQEEVEMAMEVGDEEMR